MTIIFNEVDRNITAVHKIQGCEKMIIVRGTLAFNLTIESVSISDPHKRALFLKSTGVSEDICICCDNTAGNNIPCVACGQELIFRLDTVDPQAHVFVEILDDTCVPEPCCDC